MITNYGCSTNGACIELSRVAVQFVFEHSANDAFALLLNAAEKGVGFTVAPAPHQEWALVTSSDSDQTVQPPVSTLIVRDASLTGSSQ